MAAASSIPPPTTVHSSSSSSSSLGRQKVLFSEKTGGGGREIRRPEDQDQEEEEEDASTTGSSDPPAGLTLRDLADLEPEEIGRRLAKTRQELSNRRKILMKNLPQDTTNQGEGSLEGGVITWVIGDEDWHESEEGLSQRTKDGSTGPWLDEVSNEACVILNFDVPWRVWRRVFSGPEVHEFLREYELKYCFVDRNKGTGKIF
ncbi:hypothetical protein NHX12_032784 [Muraenolepis orangiensis]|uniref:Uncharacterized protein n=1 Tax=Muraenolepis orangiensis TaxID=630683 RepID=A0A9Q0E4T5_9TELE|nr:hypothetical protein NHX12_032784 [Muraenolepis orangiensis]